MNNVIRIIDVSEDGSVKDVKTAVELRRNVSQNGAKQVFYKLSEPLEDYEYVMVSAQDFAFMAETINLQLMLLGNALSPMPETYIFGTDANGNILNLAELEGSYRGGLDHAQALENAGYYVILQRELSE